MIIDKIENCEKYFPISENAALCFTELKKLSSQSEPKRYVIDGDNVFINHSAYTNKNVDDCSFESHGKYIDIQYVISGSERIDVCSADGLSVTEDRMTEGDIAFYKAPEKFIPVTLSEGEFVLIFPGEAHRPCVAPDGKPVPVVKSVGKVLWQK